METNTNNKSEWAEREMGALWKRENSNQKYLTGKIKVDGVEKNVVIFSNKHKQKDTHPDFRVYLSRDREAVALADSSEGEASEELL
jgi:uncharacterized protein (DUF736 family)